MESIYNESLILDDINNFSTTNSTHVHHALGYNIFFFIICLPAAVITLIGFCSFIYFRCIKPIFIYSRNKKQKVNIDVISNKLFMESLDHDVVSINTNCCICLEEIDNSQDITLNCGHSFHKSCLKEWLKTQQKNNNDTNCPLCREIINL